MSSMFPPSVLQSATEIPSATDMLVYVDPVSLQMRNTTVGEFLGVIGGGVSVKTYGAKGDGDTLDFDAFQDAIDAALAGHGVVFLPPGRFNLRALSSLQLGAGGLIFRGSGKDQTILLYDEGTTETPNYLFRSTESIAKRPIRFEGIGFEGTLDGTTALGGHSMWLQYFPSVEVVNCRWYNCRGMAVFSNFMDRFVATNCDFENIGKDALHVREAHDVLIHGNRFRRTGDDAIAVHVADYEARNEIAAGHPISNRVIITNNISINTGRGIAIGGAGRQIQIAHNVIDLADTYGIKVWVSLSGTEATVPAHDVMIHDNLITDPITAHTTADPGVHIYVSSQTARGSAGTNNKLPLRFSTGTTFIKPWDHYEGDLEDAAYALPPLTGLSIKNNICRRAKPAVAAISEYGYGSRLWQGIATDMAVAESDLRASYGILLDGTDGFHDIQIVGNKVEHCTTGIDIPGSSTDELGMSGAILDNTIFDCIDYGILLYPNAARNCNLTISRNRINLDPYRANANSNTDGTYDASSTPTGISWGSAEGLVITDNEFLNCCNLLTSLEPAKGVVRRNRLYCSTPVTPGTFSTSNKGIGLIPTDSDAWDIIVADCDPTSATYMDISRRVASTRERILASSGAGIPNTGNTTENTVVTVTVPAYAMGPNGYVEVFLLATTSANTNTKAVKVYFNGTSYFSVSHTTATQQTMQILAKIHNRNSLSSQVGANQSFAGIGANVNATPITSSHNTAGDLNLTITLQCATSGSDTITLERYVVKVCYAP